MTSFNAPNNPSLSNCAILCVLLVFEVLELDTFNIESSKEAIGKHVLQWLSISLQESPLDVFMLCDIS